MSERWAGPRRVRAIAARAVVLSALACAVTWVTPSPAYALGTLSVADGSVVEGTGGVRTLEFVVSLSVANPLDVTVDYATADGSAVAPGDYTSASDELTIPAGATSAVISVSVTTDSFPEPNETLTVTLSNPSIGTSIGDGSATGTITNDDGPPPALSIDDPTVAETDAPGTVDFTVSLASAALQDTTVSYATSSGTATSDQDFGASSGIAAIPTGESSTLVSVPIVGDDLDEADESFTLTLSSPRNATIADATGTATITDDDLPPTVSADEPSAGETDGPTSLVFTVSLDAPSGQTATVDFATAEGTATPGTDYTATSGTLIFDPGDESGTVTVPVIGDDIDEPDETVLLVLSSPLNAIVSQTTYTGTIVDDEPIPTLSIADVSIAEGDDGTTTALVTATLSTPSGQAVSVDAATTQDGTATDGADYDAAQAQLTFAPGTTTQTLSVPVHGDLLDEADETVIASLTNAVNATIADGTATLTITDDDATPTLSISDGSIEEGDDGSVELDLTLTLSAPSGRDVSVSVSTSSGTATGGADFAAQSGTVVEILAGATTAQVPVSVFGDLTDEADETFTVNLAGPTNATIGDGSGTVTILDDDTGPSLTINDVSALEGTNPAGTNTPFGFTVTLSAVSQQTVTVEYSTTSSTATAGATEDFEAATGTVTFTPGQTTRPISVNVNRDAHAEPSEAFLVVLSSPTNAALVDSSGTGTILNDDGPPASLSIADVAVDEDAGVATLTVTLSSIASQPVSVDLATTDGSAGEPDDYGAVSETVTIPSGETTATTDVTIVDDAAHETAETFTAALSTARNASIGDGAASVTITDDDDEPTVSIADVTIAEGEEGMALVSLSSPSFEPVTVHAATSDGTATDGSDYTAISTDVTFPPGETSQQLPLTTLSDDDPEADESFTITLSAPDGATLGDASASGGVTDDDAAGTFTPLAPSRLLDTRSGIGRPGTNRVSPGESVVLDVTGVGGLPTAGVAGVVLNVTVTAPQGPGFVTATPAGGNSTSNVNFVTDENVANSVIVPVGPDGNVRLLVSGSATHVVADVFGFFADDEATAPGSHFTSLVPDRILDTRIGTGTPGGSTQPLGAGTTGVLDVTGVGGVPASGVSAVIVNVTVTEPTAGSFLSVTPNGGTSTSNINFAAGETAAGLVIVPVGANGSIRYQVGFGTTHVVADVLGWFAAPGSLTGSVLSTVAPSRLADTREAGGPLGPQEQGFLVIEGEAGIPEDGVAAAVLNLTATQPTAPSFLAATPDGEVGTSNLNFAANQTVANLAVVPVHPEFGDVVVYNHAGFVHVVVDVFAWFTTPVE